MKKITKKSSIMIGALVGAVLVLILMLLGEGNLSVGKRALEYYLPIFKVLRETGRIFTQEGEVPILGSVNRDVFFSEARLLNLIFMALPAVAAYVICFALKIVLSLIGMLLLEKRMRADEEKDYVLIAVISGLAIALIPVDFYYWFAICSLPIMIYFLLGLKEKWNVVSLVGMFLLPIFGEFLHIGIYLVIGILIYFVVDILVSKKVNVRIPVADLLFVAGFAPTEYRLIRMLINEEASIVDNLLLPWQNKGAALSEILLLVIVLLVILGSVGVLKFAGRAKEGKESMAAFAVPMTAFVLLLVIPFGNNPFTGRLVGNDSIKEYYCEEYFEGLKTEINYLEQWTGAYGIPSAVLQYNGFRVVDGEIPYSTYYTDAYLEEYAEMIKDGEGGTAVLPVVDAEEYKDFDGRLLIAKGEMEKADENGWVLLGNVSNSQSDYSLNIYRTASRYLKYEHSGIPYEERDCTYSMEEFEECENTLLALRDEANEYRDAHPELRDEEIVKHLEEDIVLSNYKRMIAILNDCETSYWMTNIEYDSNIYDEEMSAKASNNYADLIDLYDRIQISAREMLQSPYKESFRSIMSESIIESLLDYEDMTEEEKEIESKLDSLSKEFDLANYEEYYFDYKGHTWSWSEYFSSGGELERDDSVAIYNGIMKERGKALGEIYKEVIQLNNRKAELSDYDNYVDYGYEMVYFRDFSAEEIAKVFTEIKNSKDYLAGAASVLQSVSEYDPGYCTENDTETYELLYPYVNDIDEELGSSMQYLLDYHLYDLTESDTKADTGYSIGFASYGDAYIFNSPFLSSSDFNTFIHEFGHYNNYFYVHSDFLEERSTQDVSEIQSQGLEVLMTPSFQDIFGTDAGTFMEVNTVVGMFDAIRNAALYGEFEIYAFEHPEATAEELSQQMMKLGREYGYNYSEGLEGDYAWTQIPHFFQAPLYYVSYMTSAIPTLQLYELSLENHDLAVEKYMEFSTLESKWTYRAACEFVGMKDPFKKGTVSSMLKNIYFHLYNMTEQYRTE